MKKLIRGQSLFEVVVAIAILAIVLVGVVSLAATSVSNSSYSKNKTRSNRYSQEAFEWLGKINERDGFFELADLAGDSITYPNGRKYCFPAIVSDGVSDLDLIPCPSANIPNTPFSRHVTLTSIPPDGEEVLVTIEVEWDDAKGTHVVKTSTTFTYWRGQ